MHQLWTEAYRPDTVDGYVFKDPAQREQVEMAQAEDHPTFAV